MVVVGVVTVVVVVLAIIGNSLVLLAR